MGWDLKENLPEPKNYVLSKLFVFVKKTSV